FVEEVARFRDDDDLHARLCGQLRGERAQAVRVAELVMLAMHEQKRLAASVQESEVVHVDGRADADERGDTAVIRADFQADSRGSFKIASSCPCGAGMKRLPAGYKAVPQCKVKSLAGPIEPCATPFFNRPSETIWFTTIRRTRALTFYLLPSAYCFLTCLNRKRSFFYVG